MKYFLYSLTFALAMLFVNASYAQNCRVDLQLDSFKSAISDAVIINAASYEGSKLFEYKTETELSRFQTMLPGMPAGTDTVLAFHPNAEEDTMVNIIAFSNGCAIGSIQMSWDRFQLLDIYVTGKTPA